LDPATTWLIKQSSDIISPVIAAICDRVIRSSDVSALLQKGDYPTMPEEAELRPPTMLPHIDPSPTLVFSVKGYRESC